MACFKDTVNLLYDYFLIICLLSLEEQTCELRSCVDQYQWQQKLLSMAVA